MNGERTLLGWRRQALRGRWGVAEHLDVCTVAGVQVWAEQEQGGQPAGGVLEVVDFG